MPGVDEPGLVQGSAEPAEEDGELVSSSCSDHRALQKVPEHGQQLCRGRSRGRIGKKVHSPAPSPTGIFLADAGASSPSTAQRPALMGTLAKGRFSPSFPKQFLPFVELLRLEKISKITESNH